jgi:hypothetical protein
MHGRHALLVLAFACATAPPDPARYRLAHSGEHWDVVAGDRVLDDLRPRYPELFEVILDPSATHDPDLRAVRRDLERRPVDRRNYDALNAVAIAYFELNYRANASRDAPHYLADNLRAAQLLAIPWRAYGEVEEARLRDAILDFFEDAGSGEKLASAATAPRLARVVGSLERKELDPTRGARIRSLALRLAGDSAEPE